jgi:hypothetical protein
MQAFRETPKTTPPALSVPLPLAIDFTIALGTLPLIALLTAAASVAESWTRLGQASEEIFRGDRLPTLPLMSDDIESIER